MSAVSSPELYVKSPILNVLTFGNGVPTFRRQLRLNDVIELRVWI